jgi:hypothetical protein
VQIFVKVNAERRVDRSEMCGRIIVALNEMEFTLVT